MVIGNITHKSVGCNISALFLYKKFTTRKLGSGSLIFEAPEAVKAEDMRDFVPTKSRTQKSNAEREISSMIT
jgi:hypothetical protein